MASLALPDIHQQPVVQSMPTMAPELTDTVRAGLLDLATKVMKEEQSARRAEVRKAWEGRSFAKGEQHMWWDKRSHIFLSPTASDKSLPRYMDVYNLTTPHKRSIENLLAQPTLGINFTPDDLQQSNDVTGAAYAEKMRARVDQIISIKDRQSEACGYFCTDGRVMSWVRLDKQGKLWVTMHGVLESKIPLYVRGMDRWSYAVLAEEIDRHEAMSNYPDYAPEIESYSVGTAEAQYERYARLGVISDKRGGEGDSLKSVVTEANVWLRPSRYRKAEGETALFLQSCPNGIRVTVCGGVVVDAIPESMDDVLKVDWPSPGQGGSRPSMMADVIPVQKAFNDFVNHQREQADYIDPTRYIDNAALDEEAIAEQIAAPDSQVGINLKAGQTVADVVQLVQSGGMSPELSAACTFLMNFAEFVTGDFSALQGEGDPHAETLGGQKLLTNQAKGQLSNAWAASQRLFAGVYDLAVRCQARLDADKQSIAISGGEGQDSFRPGAILEGNWGCYPSQDSSFPETMADKRASLQAVLTQLGPADPSLVLNPDNQKLIKQYSGLKDLVILASEARDKQLEEIEQMLNEPPIPDEAQMQQYMQQVQQAESQGQQPPPPPLTSSVPIDVVYDYHQWEYAKLQEWLSTKACREQLRKGNQQGVQNVKLHGNLHKAELDKAAQAAAPKPEPPKVSLSMAVTDPNTIAQFVQAAGAVATTPTDIADSQIGDEREQAAKTAHVASQAQHVSVLAAKEAVEPAGGFAANRPVVVPPKESK